MPRKSAVPRLVAPERALIDISVAVSPATPEWPGDTPFSCGWTLQRQSGDAINLGEFTSSPHVGTHADAPLHVDDDWIASEQLPLGAFMGAAYVVDASNAPTPLTLEWLQGQFAGEPPARLLIRTLHSIARGVFPDHWPVLTQDAAQWLAESGTRLVGTDAPSVDSRHSKELPVHHELFRLGAFVLENLSLEHVAPGWYELSAAPLKLVGMDAAPVRAVLRVLP